jgi:hypothetical protein
VRPNTANCLESWADELLSRANRVRNLIGDAHWLSDGFHKEELLRQFLTRHLPASLRVTRGFVRDSTTNTNVSPEIDVLVTDAEAELPWFFEGTLMIVPPSSVRAHLHVKTEIGPTELTSVFNSALRVYKTCEHTRDCGRLWSGGVFFAQTHYP